MFCLYFSRPSSLLPPLGETLQTMLLFRWIVFFYFSFEVWSFQLWNTFFFSSTRPTHTSSSHGSFMQPLAGCWLPSIPPCRGTIVVHCFMTLTTFRFYGGAYEAPLLHHATVSTWRLSTTRWRTCVIDWPLNRLSNFFCCSKFRIAVWSSDENVTYGGYWAAKSADASSLIEKM